MLAFVLLLCAALPISWLIAEFRGGIVLRLTLGVTTIIAACLLGGLKSVLNSFGHNTYFTSASKELLETAVQQLREGKTEAVLRELSKANESFRSTYQDKGRYREIVNEAVAGMRKESAVETPLPATEGGPTPNAGN